MNASGQLDNARGVRQFIVGTGGAFFTGWPTSTRRANSQISQNKTFGVLRLTLHASSYDWAFQQIAGSPVPFSDSGTTLCH